MAKNYTIMRFAKVKSTSSLVALERHGTQRERLKHRTRPENEAYVINNKHYPKDMSLLNRFKKLTEGFTLRKDSVLALEFVFAYSPAADGTFDKKEWTKANIKWLSEEFGGSQNIIHFRYDHDESTDHIHAVVVPIHNGRLSARHYINGGFALSKMQDRYAAAMAPFGLHRGVCGLDNPELPVKRHKSLKEYYKDLSEEVAEINKKVFGDERGDK